MSLIQRVAGRRTVNWRLVTGATAAQLWREAEHFAATAHNGDYRAFAWQGPPAVVALSGGRVVAAGWVYVGQDEVDEFEEVVKFDLLVAPVEEKQGLGKQVFDATLAAAWQMAKRKDLLLRVSVSSPRVERWLAAKGFGEVKPWPETDTDDITYWELMG